MELVEIREQKRFYQLAKKKLNKTTLVVLAVFLAIMAILAFTGIIPGGSGIRVGWSEQKGTESWTANYSYFTGTRTSRLQSKDTNVCVKVNTDSGHITVTIKDSDKKEIYSQEIQDTTSLNIQVPEQIVVTVTAKGHKGGFDISYQPVEQANLEHGQIFLYGEEHAKVSILETELNLWGTYYKDNGMRHLFVELPYYTAEFLNLWMKSDDDIILGQLYKDWEGTAMHSQDILDFYSAIKENYPETIFHGTDIGHQFNTTGLRYLEYLSEIEQAQSEAYMLTQEVIEQGQKYYKESNTVYRENALVENFKREFDKLNGENIMGIYGVAHTDINGMDYKTNTVPCMANQLAKYYGATLHSENLTQTDVSSFTLEIISINGVDYEAVYFGKQDLTSFLEEYQYREFWQLLNAYSDFIDCPTTGDMLPYNNYPVQIETGQIFVIDYTKNDGSVVRKYYRSDGNLWNNILATEEFIIN